MTTQALLTFAAAVLALGLKPGPGMMMVMSRTLAQGMSACFAFLGGFLLMTFVYLMLAFASFQLLDFDIVFISILVKTLAAVYLIWMGIRGLQNVELNYTVEECKEENFFDGFFGGLALTAANPLVIVFYAGILPSLIDVTAMTFDDMTIITLIVLVLEGGLVLCYCTPLALFRKKASLDFLKGLRIFSSIMMILLGLYIGYTALPSQDLLAVF